ncbi:hypothetical protein TeGR_g12173 [Tetraparma gracilis]|uniref:Uncharacterized protein n=1 Tax=Tetraparma gracilis TaxID=2962635 RepID=A0ABQ6MVW9_9STRA|nr:hypothetical protein TeGR_g12173 [Tetraparma gracilis]
MLACRRGLPLAAAAPVLLAPSPSQRNPPALAAPSGTVAGAPSLPSPRVAPGVAPSRSAGGRRLNPRPPINYLMLAPIVAIPFTLAVRLAMMRSGRFGQRATDRVFGTLTGLCLAHAGYMMLQP